MNTVVAVELIAVKNFIAPNTCEDICGQVLLANLTLLRLGVQRATEKLYVFCEDTIMNTIPSLPDLNSEVYDICLLHNKPRLNCIILNKYNNQLSENAYVFVPPKSVVSSVLSNDLNFNIIDTTKELYEVLFGQSYRLFKSNPTFCERMYDYVVIGGTFDRFHGGHKQLLSASLLICKQTLVVGVTQDIMFKDKKGSKNVQSISLRKRNVVDFCEAFAPNIVVEMHEIGDPFGPSIVDTRLQAIVVSSETLKGARLVNDKRKEGHLKALDCIAVRRTNAYTLSSTFLRSLDESPKL